MMNPRYLQRFGEPPPFGDPIARAALRYDPEAPYGEPELGDNEGQRLFEQPDVQPSRNKDSMVAAGGPMSQPPVTASPSAPMENPIVRAARERAEPVNDPYLNYDPEVPIREARQAFRPPPTIESNALKSIVPPPDAPEIDSGPLPPPPVIDTRELPTEAPPENPIRRYQRELDALQAPERGPVSKWAKLAAVALGAGQGYYNAANPNAKPIDASEAVQNLTLGRKYIDAMGEYQRKRKDIGERIKLAGEAEQVETNRTYRESLAANSRRVDEDRDEAQRLKNFQFSIRMAQDGGKTVPANSPVTSGAIRMPNPLDKTGNTVVDIVPKNESRKIADKDIADALGMNVNDFVSDTMYQEAFKKVMEYRQALKLKQIEVENKNPPALQPGDVLLKEAQKPGSFPPAVVSEAKRQFGEMHRPPSSTIMMPSLAPGSDGSVNPTVASMANYDTPLPPRPTRNPLAITEWDDLVKQIKIVNPKFQVAGSRVVSDFARGKPADSLNAINTGAGHVGMLADAALALDSGDIKLLNKIANYAGGQAGNDKLAVYKTIVHRLGPEITRAYVGAGGALNDRIGTEEDFDPALGTKVILGNIRMTAKLFDSKIKALGHQLEQGAPGRKFEGYISPEAQNVFDRFVLKSPAMNAGPGGDGGSGPKNGDIKTYPNGNKARFDGTGWVKQ